ncbi:flagellar basal body-associated protein FliL [Bacillota bacterium Lsc_1132]
MLNKKLVRTMVILMLVIALAGTGAAVYIVKYNGKSSKGPTIDDVLKYSVDVSEITTNLASDNYAKMAFKIQTNSKKAKDELTKRDFQVRNIIIEELSEKKAEDLQGKAGKLQLEEALKTKINQVMQDGKVVQVYITESLLQ